MKVVKVRRSVDVHAEIPGDFLKNKKRKVKVKGDFFLSRMCRCNRRASLGSATLTMRK